jgi:hypothetical protein
MKYQALDIARQYLFVREAGANTGQRVEAIQRWSGGQPGESWCCYFATMVLDICYEGKSPVPRLGVCQDVYELAKQNDWITPVPMPGDLVLSIDPEKDHAHHIGIVAQVAPLTSIAGNTDDTGSSSNGDRVAEHPISPANKVFVRVPRG